MSKNDVLTTLNTNFNAYLNDNDIKSFNAKTFNRLNKNLKDGALISKMLVNYKWQYANHLSQLEDKTFSTLALISFNLMVKTYNVKLKEDKKDA